MKLPTVTCISPKCRIILILGICGIMMDLVHCHSDTLRLFALAEKTDYVTSEIITVTVLADKHINETIWIRPHFDPNGDALKCVHNHWCNQQAMDGQHSVINFVWYGSSASALTIYFTVESQNKSQSVVNVDVSKAFVSIRIGQNHWLHALSEIAGWTYFFLWVFSMYPQILLNQKRKSVVGLNFDYLALSLIGYAAYALFNCCLYFGPVFQHEYQHLYPHSNLPVQLNDVFFSVHGVLASLVMVLQCLAFESAGQRMTTKVLVIVCGLMIISGWKVIELGIKRIDPLSFIYFFSYIKVILTLGKYVPQAWFNYERKSTSGWCIQNVLLDIMGGILSFIQMLLLAINYCDRRYFTTNLAKLGVATISILFDILFLVQHYILYANGDQHDHHQPLVQDALLCNDNKCCRIVGDHLCVAAAAHIAHPLNHHQIDSYNASMCNVGNQDKSNQSTTRYGSMLSTCKQMPI